MGNSQLGVEVTQDKLTLCGGVLGDCAWYFVSLRGRGSFPSVEFSVRRHVFVCMRILGMCLEQLRCEWVFPVLV